MLRLSGLLFLVCLEGVAFARSPYPWATYYAPRRTAPVIIDGDLAEWKNVNGFALDQEKFFFVGQGMSSSRWTGPSDLSAVFRVQWDEEYIYIALEIADDRVTEPHGSLQPGTKTGSWDDDGIEVMFDNDGCGMPRYYIGDPMHHEFHFVYSARQPFVFDNFWKRQPGAPAPVFTLPNGANESLAYPGEAMAKNDITAVFSEPPYHGRYAFRRTERGYNFELRMALPGATMRAINDDGHPIGFDIAINDNDEGTGALKQQLHWSGINDMFWRNCQFFGTLILINK